MSNLQSSTKTDTDKDTGHDMNTDTWIPVKHIKLNLIRASVTPRIWASVSCRVGVGLFPLEMPRAVPLACGPSNTSVDESILIEKQERVDNGANDGRFSVNQFHGRSRHKVDPARDLSIQVLEKFSLVTRFARETTSQLFGENQSNGFSPIDRRTHIQTNLDHPKSSNVEENTFVESPVVLDSQEFDNLSLVWGKPRQPPLGSEEV
ncbi:hypothetical protein glysoja_036509 [Glycine soja]|uniref:Uncharacterized protein n=2 Tax=Glycine subgen. Soja TaxID=1462606 RepID=A0A0B2PS43_GLYSO|nr:hypothetical protein glysoja_036509 [Glycine soja]